MRSLIMGLLLLAVIVAPTVSHAKSDASLKLEEFKYKRWNKAGADTRYPEDGPFIVVNASNTEYNRILDLHTDTQIIAETTASCSNRGKVSNLSLQAGAGPKEKVSGNSFRTDNWILKLPREEFNALDPIAQCNRVAEDLAAKNNKRLADIVKEGFVVTLPRKFKVAASMSCDGHGLQRGDYKGQSMEVDAYIVCDANPTAGRAKSGKPTTRPVERPQASEGKKPITSAFKTARVSMTKMPVNTTCPATIGLSAWLEFDSATEVTAQWVASGGYKSPKQSVTAKGSGRQQITHNLIVEAPEKSTMELAAPGKSDIIDGWVRLVITHRVKQGMASTNKKWQSKKLDYQVNCQPLRAKVQQLKAIENH